jgi:hypothetical protein
MCCEASFAHVKATQLKGSMDENQVGDQDQLQILPKSSALQCTMLEKSFGGSKMVLCLYKTITMTSGACMTIR